MVDVPYKIYIYYNSLGWMLNNDYHNRYVEIFDYFVLITGTDLSINCPLSPVRYTYRVMEIVNVPPSYPCRPTYRPYPTNADNISETKI